MQSGIASSKELHEQFNQLLAAPDAFALVVSITGEALVPVELVSAASGGSASFDDNLALLAPHLQPKQPVYALLRRHDAAPRLVAVTYVPDAAPVRQKMLFASTRNALTRELGTEHFRDHVFATDAKELTPQGFRGIDDHAKLEAPLTEEERSLGEVKRAEAEAGQGSAMREIHLSKSLAMPVAEDALAALKGIADDGGLVVLKISPESETVQLDVAEPASSAPRTITDLAARTSTTDPRFSFFRYPHTHAGAESAPLLFIYTNPSTGGTKAIKTRMLYPLMKRAVVEAAAREGVVVDKRFEVENPAELTDETVLEELHPKAEVKQAFSRPKRPGR